MTDPRLTPLAASLPATVPFVGPESQERARGAPFVARLGANENVFGPSPKAIAAMSKSSASIWMYADPEAFELRQALAAHHNVRPHNVMIGEGIDGLFGYLVRLFIGPGDRVVTSDGAYPTFNYHVTGYGGEIVRVPYKGDFEDPDALMTAAGDCGAKLIYIANPDNPMASWHAAPIMKAMIAQVPDHALLVLDEAYVEFAPDGTAPPIDADDPRVLRFRTFSKAYGMAGGRVGYAIGTPEVIAAFERVRNHFGMNRAALAGALAALKDQPYLEETCARVALARTQIADVARNNGLLPLPSATNFVTIDCGHDGAFARVVLEGLVAAGIFVRMPFVAPQNRCIRVSVGRAQDIAAFAQALPQALEAARNQTRMSP